MSNVKGETSKGTTYESLKHAMSSLRFVRRLISITVSVKRYEELVKFIESKMILQSEGTTTGIGIDGIVVFQSSIIPDNYVKFEYPDKFVICDMNTGKAFEIPFKILPVMFNNGEELNGEDK